MSDVTSVKNPAMNTPTDLEEPHEAALRIALGLRPTAYEWGDPVIDPRPCCPSWCLYGGPNGEHEIDPDRPFDAIHALGAGPHVALSRYPAERVTGAKPDGGWYSCASLRFSATQDGADEPVVRISVPASALEVAGENRLVQLTLTDAHELRTALTYMLDVLEGRRDPVEDPE